MKTKNQLIRLDDLDWKILKSLQNDARQTYTEIGHSLGLAHSTIYDRIKRMEEQGIIKKYTTIFDLQRIGIKKITAIVTIFTDPKKSRTWPKNYQNSLRFLKFSHRSLRSFW